MYMLERHSGVELMRRVTETDVAALKNEKHGPLGTSQREIAFISFSVSHSFMPHCYSHTGAEPNRGKPEEQVKQRKNPTEKKNRETSKRRRIGS